MDQDSEPASRPGPSLFKRACDPCRSRKVKCDKETPVCSACKASNLECVTSDRREAVKRKRIHVSDDYERKIDLIEEKLASLDQVLQRGTFPLSTPGSGVQQSSPSRPTSSATTPGTGARPRTLFEDGDQPDADGDAYEGDTSLNAHSVQARALVERVLGQGVFASTSPEVSSAVSSLLDLSNGRRKRIPKPYVQNGGGGFDYRRLPLPPTRIVLDVLRQCREVRTVTFDMILNWMSLSRLTELCKSVFFSVEDYPLSTAILVHGNLYMVLVEAIWRTQDEHVRAEYTQCIELCRSNFEICVSNLDLMLSATPENIESLLIGAMHAVDNSRLNVSWKLKSMALTLAQTLGWHRASAIANDDQETRIRKSKIFYFLYVLDKGLSLRLGRASFFQDYDIDLPYPELGDDPLSRASTEEYRIFIQVGRIQGLIYEQLYSPGALRESEEIRMQRARMLVEQLDGIRHHSLRMTELWGEVNKPGHTTGFVYDIAGVLSVFLLSDAVTHYTNVCMCYRAIPTANETGLQPECLAAARSALDTHQGALKLKHDHKGMWQWYLAWTILFAPFIPFLVVFSHVLATADTTDLARLKAFTESIADSDFSEGARKMHHICSMFYRIARLYVNAKQSQNQNQQQQVLASPTAAGLMQSQGSTPHSGAGDLTALNPYLNAIGFAGDPMLDLGTGISSDLGDWFGGNQFVMGLMDGDVYGGMGPS